MLRRQEGCTYFHTYYNEPITIKKFMMMSTKEVIHVMDNNEESNLYSKTQNGWSLKTIHMATKNI